MTQNHIFVQEIKKIYSFYLFLPSYSLSFLYLTNILIISSIIFLQLITSYYILFATLIIYI